MHLPGHRAARGVLALLLAASGLLVLPARAAPTVAASVRVRTESWIPLSLKDMERAVRTRVLSELGQEGLLHFREEQDGAKDPDATPEDLRLEMEGLVVEDAEQFTVVLTLKPARSTAFPSFVAAATTSIGQKDMARIYQQIDAAAKDAAGRLAAALRARRALLEGSPDTQAVLEQANEELYEWGRILPPRVKLHSADLRTLASLRAPVEQRLEAARSLARQALYPADARHLLERVALTDPLVSIRAEAVRLLEPLAPRHELTRQVVLAVARTDTDPGVRGVALRVSRACLAFSPRETLQTWVQLLGTKVGELGPGDFSDLVKELKRRPEIPNLELGVLACLRQKQYQGEEGRRRKEECLSVLDGLSPMRRTRALLGYLGLPLTPQREDLPEGNLDGPLGRALRLARRDGCHPAALWHLLKRRLDEAPGPGLARRLLEELVWLFATPELVGRYPHLMEQISAKNIYNVSDRLAALQDLNRAARKREPMWNVLAWPAMASLLQDHEPVCKKLLERGDTKLEWMAKRELQEVRAGLRALRELEQQGHLTGLRALLHSGAPPVPEPGAVLQLARCVLQEQQARARTECAEGLRWIARHHPRLRHRAVAAVQGLLDQARQPLAEQAARVLRTVEPELTELFRAGLERYVRAECRKP